MDTNRVNLAFNFLSRKTTQRLRTFLQIDFDTLLLVVLNFLMVVICAPIVEELLFRGFLFSQLRTTKLGIYGSIILTSLIWTSIHLQYDLLLLIPIFFLGLLLGYLMHKYNSLYLVIIVHAVHNLQATLFIEFFYDYFY